MAETKKTCFIIMPISTPDSFLEKYRDGEEHFDHVLKCLFTPSVEAAGYEAISPIAKGSDLIHAEIISNLEQSDLVLCDMSCLNPNVFFEFGIRTSLNKPVCVVKDELTQEVPFDTGILNYQLYKETLEAWELPNEIQKLAEHIKTSEERSNGENTLWKYFGFKSKAKPYEGETGTEGKIDYLTLQMDSFRQQLDDILQRPPRKFSPMEINRIMEKMIGDLPMILPDGVRLGELKEEAGGLLLTYVGDLDDDKKERICQIITRMYGIPITIRRVLRRRAMLPKRDKDNN